MAKSIRVSQLAKELGVKSKEITDKLASEDVTSADGKEYRASSTVGVGLSMTIKDWFSGAAADGGGTAVAAATPVKAEVRSRVRQKVAERESDDGDESDQNGTATAVAEPPPAPRPTPRPVPTPSPTPAPRMLRDIRTGRLIIPEAEKPVARKEPERPAVKAEQPVVSDTKPAMTQTPAPVQPEQPKVAAAAPVPKAAPSNGTAAPAPQRPAATPPAGGEQARPPVTLAGGRQMNPATGMPEPVMRPTITLAEKQREIQERLKVERDAKRAAEGPVTPAPQLSTLKKAEIAGPKVVRVEAPDHVPTPRKRREPGAPGPGQNRIPTGPLAKGGGGVRPTLEDENKAKTGPGAAKSLSSRRRGGDGRRGEAVEKLREFTDADIIARRDALNAARANRSLLDRQMLRTAKKGKGFRAASPSEQSGPVIVNEPITVKTLSNDLGVKSGSLIRALMKQGTFATINQALSAEQAEGLAMEFGIDIEVARQPTAEERLVERFKEIEDGLDDKKLASRPPIVTILGHVDHGKTSLLDKIRSANVVAGEAGGITQHVAAFDVTVEREGKTKQVTFIDTPGHQAFTAMRARGAQVTDIVVLVIDAAQGIQPQTVESINHAKAAGVPIVVALNKIDRPDANPDKVLGELAAQDLNPAEWGGETEVVRTSALTGQGIPDLLEILDLQAELMELKGATDVPARGRVIEARMTQGLGPVATVLVQGGTLKVGDYALAGMGYGKIRALQKANGQMVKEVGPSTPILVSGFNEVPAAGDAFFVMPTQDEAEAVADERRDENRQEELSVRNRVSLETLFDTVEEGKIKTINLIIKGDVQGSVETLKATVGEQNTAEVRVKVIHSAVGSISESDIELAAASGAVVIGFHVGIDESARHLSEARHVEIRTYNVIYEIFDDLKKALSGMLEPEIREVYKGTAEVRATFKASRLGTIAGCYVTDGVVTRASMVRLLRDGGVIAEDLKVNSLRRLKDDVREVKNGLECGVNLEGYDDLKENDKLEFFIRETVARTL